MTRNEHVDKRVDITSAPIWLSPLICMSCTSCEPEAETELAIGECE